MARFSWWRELRGCAPQLGIMIRETATAALQAGWNPVATKTSMAQTSWINQSQNAIVPEMKKHSQHGMEVHLFGENVF